MSETSAYTDSRSKRHPELGIEINGYQSVMSVRSSSSFEKNGEEGESRESVHDIFRRRSSLGASVAKVIASPDIATGGIALSIQGSPERNWAGLIFVPSEPRTAETRSPLSLNNHSLSHTTEPGEDSPSSSPDPINCNLLHSLQSNGPIEYDILEPLAENEIDPVSFNLISSCYDLAPHFSLESRSEILFSKEHLEVIFDDPRLFRKFMNFLHAFRPKSVPLVAYYLDALKAVRAISYANAITQSLVTLDELTFGEEEVSNIVNKPLLEKGRKAFESLTREDLPAYITHIWIRTIRVVMKERITETLPNYHRDLSEGLSEVFCLTDPSRADNPVIFASKEFHKMTQYGMNYALGQNCRFLQGPHTSISSARRIREHLKVGKEHCETFLNYRRDGSPFMNLLMVAPLIDSRGTVRYHIGAQVDVSGLAKECSSLESLKRLINAKDEFRELVEMLSTREMEIVRKSGGEMHRTHDEDVRDAETILSRLKLRPLSMNDAGPERCDFNTVLHSPSSSGGRSGGIYEDYLLVRPYPNLRVLFASPSLRFPGMLQSNFMSRIGGSRTIREEIVRAFANGRGITTKVRWVTKMDSYGKGRWIRSTPLFGSNGTIGIWMVVLVNDNDNEEAIPRRTRDAPPVDFSINRLRPFDEDTLSVPGPSNTDRELQKA
ncbi:hypothetical protein K449DRAFT_461638 [Hypoxylon sp. EC38]|nr:hypothetical protein K449DRAFT_461638 [Hypoxylon sp. EC38]